MATIRIVGQPPKLRDALTNQFIRVAPDGHVIQAGEILQVSSGGGFDDPEYPQFFRAPGTICRIIRVGDPRVYSVTEVSVPDT